MNETLKTLETRRSCRSFKPDMVSKEEIEAVLKAGTYAPSAMGRQSAIILAVTSKEIRDEMAKRNAAVMGAEIDPFYGAPVVLVVLAAKAMPTHDYDGSLVIGNMLNAAASLGLGSIWIHRAKEVFESDWGKDLLKKYGVTDEYVGVGNVALGYKAKEDAPAAPRKDNYIINID